MPYTRRGCTSEERDQLTHGLVHTLHVAAMASRLALRPLTRVRLTSRFTPTHIATRSASSKSAATLSAAAAKQRTASPKIASTPARGASTAAEIEAELAAEAAGENGARVAAVEVEPLDLPLGAPTSLDTATDWSRSYHGLSTQPFPKEAADILLAPIEPRDVEIKPGTLRVSFCLDALPRVRGGILVLSCCRVAGQQHTERVL